MPGDAALCLVAWVMYHPHMQLRMQQAVFRPLLTSLLHEALADQVTRV
jgi:hypothetical protein